MKQLKNKDGLTEKEFLAQYDASKYERPSNTVDMLIFTVFDNKLKLLMIKRGDHPSIGKWALPGGFVNFNENLDTAAKRELKEETGLNNIYMEQIYTWGDVGRDPRTRIITTAYMALLNSDNLKIKADDDAADAKWFDVSCELESEQKSNNKIDLDYKLLLANDKLQLSSNIRITKTIESKAIITQRQIIKSDNIASDHGKIIEHAIEVLRYKTENTSIVYSLMPNDFKLDDLKNMCEIILNKNISNETFNKVKSQINLDYGVVL